MLTKELIKGTRTRLDKVFDEIKERVPNDVDTWQADVNYFDAILILIDQHKDILEKYRNLEAQILVLKREFKKLQGVLNHAG